MKLTKKKALEIAIELWEWIVDNPGKHKYEWPGWEKYGTMASSCSLCEYARRHPKGCNCPLNQLPYCGCFFPPCAYTKWSNAMEVEGGGKDIDSGHEAAVEFLAQLKAL